MFCGEAIPTEFIIVCHFKGRKVVGKRFEEEKEKKILVFADMSRDCVILSKSLVHRFAEMYNEYNNIV